VFVLLIVYCFAVGVISYWWLCCCLGCHRNHWYGCLVFVPVYVPTMCKHDPRNTHVNIPMLNTDTT